DGKELFDLVPSTHNELSNWFVAKSKIENPLSRCCSRISEVSGTGPIAWLETLAASARGGWLENRKRITVCRRAPSQKKHIWCFLDASRSTSMNQFLPRARDFLAGAASSARSGKFHLLLLNKGEIRWQCRNATFSGFTRGLSRLKEAGGKSLIAEALTALHRRIIANRNAAKNRVLILSDGLASPCSGEQAPDTMLRLRRIVRRLVLNGSLTAWIAPAPKRGLKRWLPRLLRGLPVSHFEI